MHIGAATVSIGPVFPPGLRVDVVLTDTPEAFANGRAAKVVAVDLSWMAGKGVPVDERRVYNGSGDDICRIALTSGSTGEAKVVAFTHNNQLARLARTITCSEKHFLNARDFSAIIGSVQAGLPAHSLCAVTWRYDVFSRRFADGNSANVRAVQGAGLIASPGGLSGFLRFYEDNADFRSGFQVIISAGRPLPKSLSERVRARLCSNLIFYYGTTETSTVSSAPAHALTGVAGAAGYIAPDVSVRVVDDNGTIFEPGREGSVLVRTPVSVHGYFEELAETETPFRDGYFDTGDTGYVTPEKMLVITGRRKEILNLGGDKVSPRLIEEP
jgi:long-subunit acyl-CoA synthetase (AMP-forming)